MIGRLPDGREERRELWRANHLLAPFAQLWTRRGEGVCGGATVAFLGLDDLVRSKETERDDDWRDVALLEEIADERLLTAADRTGRVAALAGLRSRRGCERARASLGDRALAREAIAAAAGPISVAWLRPYVPEAPHPGSLPEALDVPLARCMADPRAAWRSSRPCAASTGRGGSPRIARTRSGSACAKVRLDVVEQRTGVPRHHLPLAPPGVVEPRARRQLLGGSEDERERRAQPVARVGEEPRLQAVQLAGLVVEARQLLVRAGGGSPPGSPARGGTPPPPSPRRAPSARR